LARANGLRRPDIVGPAIGIYAMKFTLSWLKDHLETDVPVSELATRLSAIGLEVESIDDPAAKLGEFVVARVIEAKQHPNADRLRVALVEIEKGKPPVEVVCGAPNCRTGLIGVFAPIGAFIPGTGITLEKKPVRGVASNGMLLSEREMQLSDNHEGIVDLPAAHAEDVGRRYIDVIGASDPVIEVKLTPNRPDCTGVRGIARDLAACGLGTLKPEPAIAGVEGTYDCPVKIELTFPAGAEDYCSAFYGRYVKGVKNGPSPAWLQARLKAIGLRPISALVDVTNYISIDRGRPLHVYDADKLKGAIRARLGKNGERFEGLDGREYAVDDTECVIADDARVLGFGGILGGEDSGTTEKTRNILIECAYFDPIKTAATGRRAGIQTDARYRFERGVDPAFLDRGLDLATRMMLDLAGGEPSKASKVGKAPIPARTFDFPLSLVEKRTGLALAEGEILDILGKLGFTVEQGATSGERRVTAPTWRPDVHGTADLVEEVVRIAGLDRVPSTPLPRLHGTTKSVLTERQKRIRRTKRLLASRGLVEAVTWSFIGREHAKLFGGGQDALELDNPISTDLTSMRPGLLPGLLAAAQRNRNRGDGDLGLFEVGQYYRGDRPEDQLMAASGVRVGASHLAGAGRHWSERAVEAGTFDVKADVIAALAALGFDAGRAQATRDAPAWYHPGMSATLRLGPKTVLAHFGMVHPEHLAALDVDGPVAAFEIFLDAIPPEKSKSRARAPLPASDLMAVHRDFAFIVDRSVAAGDVIKAALGADKRLISAVDLFDVFEGGSMGADKKSLAIGVTMQPIERTLTDEEIETVGKRIVAEVRKATGGDIRG